MSDLMSLEFIRSAFFIGILCLSISTSPSVGGPISDLRQLDRTLAKAIALPLRGTPALVELVRRETGDAVVGVDVRDALAQRESIAALMDRLRKSAGDDDALDDPGHADALVDVLRSLDAMRQLEKGRALDNDLQAITGAIWSRYVAPAVAEAVAKRVEPLAPRGKGEMAGQWIDGGKSSVRVIELWADERAKSLAWSRVEFAERIPNVDAVLDRGPVASPKPKRPRLALYVDLADRPASDRAAVEGRAETSVSGPVLYVLDDTAKRMATCLAASSASKTKGHFEELPPRLPKRSSSSKDDVDKEAEARAVAKESCVAKTRMPGFDRRAVLFDPERKIRILSADLSRAEGSLKEMLAQTAIIARVWP